LSKCCFSWLVLAGTILLLTGCWDRKEINDMAFVLTTGLDLEKDGKVRLSVLSPLPGQMGGASGGGGSRTGGDKSYYIDSEVGDTVRDAQRKLQRRMSRRLFLAHRRTLLVGEDYAKQGIRELFDVLPRSPENRMTTYMIVAKGKAYEMMQSSPKFERFPSEAMRELAKSRIIVDMNLKDVAVGLSSPGGDPIAPYMDVKESQKGDKPSKEIEIKGYAQFRGDKMIGTLEEETSFGLSWLKNKRIIEIVTLNVEGQHPMSVQIYYTKSKIDASIADGRITYMIRVNARARVLENQSFYDLSRADNVLKVESALSDHIRLAVQSLIDKSTSTNSDPAQLGGFVFRANPDEWRNRFEQDWPNGLKDAKISIQVGSQLSDTGLISDNVTTGRDSS
jgi:spore germination protein KC